MAEPMVHQGFEYEKKAYKALRKYEISTGGTGAPHDKPDLSIKTRTRPPTGCELKISATAAGSLVLKYYDGKWSYGDTKGDPEKKFIQVIGEKSHLMRELNDSGAYGARWRGKTPHLQNDPKNPRKKILLGAKSMMDGYNQDYRLFREEINIRIDAHYISDYYIKKHCSYLNVGTDGFYTLNNQDALGLLPKLAKNKLPTIPNFSRSASARLNVRIQAKGGGDYQFVVRFTFTIKQRSPYNIAPLIRGSKSDIDVEALTANPILMAFT
jgi:hypothetical protein